MQFIAGTPVGTISDEHEIVEIKLWEIYLLNNRANLHKTLAASSVDHGPVEKVQHEPGRVYYRFEASEWENNIKHLLYEYRVPVIVRPTVIHDLRPAKREGVLI